MLVWVQAVSKTCKILFQTNSLVVLYSHRCSALEPTTAARALTLPQLLTKISLSRHIFGRDHACQSGNLSTYVQVQRAYEIVCTIRQGLTRPKRVRDHDPSLVHISRPRRDQYFETIIRNFRENEMFDYKSFKIPKRKMNRNQDKIRPFFKYGDRDFSCLNTISGQNFFLPFQPFETETRVSLSPTWGK